MFDEVKSDLASEITYGDKKEKNEEHMDYEQDINNRWNLQSFGQLEGVEKSKEVQEEEKKEQEMKEKEDAERLAEKKKTLVILEE